MSCYLQGYFKFLSVETVDFKAFETRLGMAGYKFGDHACMYNVDTGDELFELRAINDDEEYYETFSDFIPSIKANKGRVMYWVAEHGCMYMSFHYLRGAYYVFISISNGFFSGLRHELGGTENTIRFFCDLYQTLNAQCFMLATEVYDEDMVKEDMTKYREVRLDYLHCLDLALSPNPEDEIILQKEDMGMRRGEYNGIVYYERRGF